MIKFTTSLNKRIAIAINPMLSRALAGGQSTFVDMKEQRELQSEVSKRLHVWLSSWIKPGESNKITLDKLIPHIWGDESEKNKLYVRRFYLRAALVELNDLEGWSCIENEDSGHVIVTRPKFKKVMFQKE